MGFYCRISLDNARVLHRDHRIFIDTYNNGFAENNKNRIERRHVVLLFISELGRTQMRKLQMEDGLYWMWMCVQAGR